MAAECCRRPASRTCEVVNRDVLLDAFHRSSRQPSTAVSQVKPRHLPKKARMRADRPCVSRRFLASLRLDMAAYVASVWAGRRPEGNTRCVLRSGTELACGPRTRLSTSSWRRCAGKICVSSARSLRPLSLRPANAKPNCCGSGHSAAAFSLEELRAPRGRSPASVAPAPERTVVGRHCATRRQFLPRADPQHSRGSVAKLQRGRSRDLQLQFGLARMITSWPGAQAAEPIASQRPEE